MQRRRFLSDALGYVAAATWGESLRGWAEEHESSEPSFYTADRRWQAAYDAALAILAGNVQVLPRYEKPVLIEGAEYAGIWQECGPQEALTYRQFRPDVARNSHTVFFALQRADGQLPANNKRSETGFGQIQMVVPIAATAWELAKATGDSELLETAYAACSRWDAWLRRYRNTRGTGLVEGFCTYDTGMDNSPRWAGMPSQCPGKDAKVCPAAAGLPRLCPDLSATVFGGRMALAAMATELGRGDEAAQWTERAEEIRRLILERLFVEEDAAFYDLDAKGAFVRVRCDVLSRVCGEHVVDRKRFDDLWARQLGNPKAFWPAFPLPSVAMDDPTFVRPIPRNSWGGPSQALTALRAGRWMEHYGRAAEFAGMMEAWCEALQRDMGFRQQMDPVTGEFTQTGSRSYSPAALVMMDYTWRLAGVREQGEELHWNVRPGVAAANGSRFSGTLQGGRAEMRYRAKGADLRFKGRELGTVTGTARLVTDKAGRPVALVGVSVKAEKVELRLPARPAKSVTVRPNERVLLDSVGSG